VVILNLEGQKIMDSIQGVLIRRLDRTCQSKHTVDRLIRSQRDFTT